MSIKSKWQNTRVLKNYEKKLSHQNYPEIKHNTLKLAWDLQKTKKQAWVSLSFSKKFKEAWIGLS